MLLGRNLAVSALIFALLELWRPCFFLTDDNLDGGFPFFSEVGLRLLHGQSPFFSDYLFGGHYNLLRDATYFAWHPVYLGASLLAGTRFHLLIVDVDAFVFFMLATAGFVNLAWYLRRELPLRLSDGWIMFYTMSFTYSVVILALGASWLDYSANYAALPWLTLGILQKKWRHGLGLVTLFSLHQILGGHPLAIVSNTIFLSLFAIGVSVWRRSCLPLGCWFAGYALALLIILPLFLPMMEGFLSSARAQGVPIQDMQENNIPPLQLPTSVFLGMALWYIHPPEHVHVTYTLAFGACAAAWCLIPALSSRAPWRGLDLISLGLVLFGGFMVCRPLWFAEIMVHLPVLKSMRWPFREMVQLQFFLHLFLLVRRPVLRRRVRRLTALLSVSLMVPPLFLYVLPPTLNAMSMNRELLFSGDFDRYWDRVRPLLKPGDRYVVLLSYDLYVQDRIERPDALLGAYDYSCLARVVNASGYSHTVPAGQMDLKTEPFFPNGAYRISQRAELLREDPQLKLITLESLQPLRITLSSGDGPVIDLNPYIPDSARNALVR
jgi:hypothetical protein